MPVAVPTSVPEALDALGTDASAMVVAGGTDTMVDINAGRRQPARVVALRAVTELRDWRVDGDHVRLGAGVTWSALLEPELTSLLPGLAQAARTVGSPQIRNAGTLGGNLVTASPAGDSLPVLVAHDARVELAGPGGVRVVPARQFLTGAKRTALAPGELVVAVLVPMSRGPQEYLKVGVRNAMVIAVASLALIVDLDRESVAVGLGSVGPTPLRAPGAEEFLEASARWHGDRIVLPPGTDAGQFAALVAEAARPIDDHRSTAAYRRHAVEVLARRALRRAVAA